MPGLPSQTLFANLTVASTVDLDANFTAISNLLKSVNNYTPYAVDAGTTNSYVVTFTGGITFALSAGAGLVFRATNANTGAATLNVNGSGAVAIKNPNGTDLASGAIALNGLVHVVYDGTNFVMISGTSAGASTSSGQTRNAIMNGEFNVWQRNTSFTSVASNTVVADRWRYMKVGTMVHDVSRSADVPTVAQAGRLFDYSILVDCTTADAAIVASDYCALMHRIEGYQWLAYAQRSCILSFWVKATKTGIYCVGLVNNGTDRSFVGEYQVNLSDTWEYKTVVLAASPSSGSWNYINGIGVSVYFTLAAGANFQTSAGAWQVTGSAAFATSNQVNATDSTANNFRVVGVQLETGLTASECEAVPFVEELARCKRYYEKSFGYATPVAQNAGTANATMGLQVVGAAAAQNGGLWARYTVGKRSTAPTVTFYNPSAANANIRNIDVAADCTTGTLTQDENGWRVTLTTAGGSAAGQQLAVHWQAEDEL